LSVDKTLNITCSGEGNVKTKTVEEPLSDELFYPTEEWQTIKPGGTDLH